MRFWWLMLITPVDLFPSCIPIVGQSLLISAACHQSYLVVEPPFWRIWWYARHWGSTSHFGDHIWRNPPVLVWSNLTNLSPWSMAKLEQREIVHSNVIDSAWPKNLWHPQTRDFQRFNWQILGPHKSKIFNPIIPSHLKGASVGIGFAYGHLWSLWLSL